MQEVKITNNGTYLVAFVLTVGIMFGVLCCNQIAREIHQELITIDWFRKDYNKSVESSIISAKEIYIDSKKVQGHCALVDPPCWEDSRKEIIRLK